MWQGQQRPFGGRQPGLLAGRSARLWLIGAGLLLAALLIIGQLNGLFSPANAPGGSSATPSDSSSYLAQGYAQLEQSNEAPATTSFWRLWLNMLIPLALVVAAFYAILRGIRFLNTRVAASASQNRVLETVDTLSLGQHGAIHLVRVGSRLVVVGAGGQQLSLLTEVGPEEAAEILAAHRSGLEDTESFPVAAGMLQSFQELVATRINQAPPEPAPSPRPDDEPPADAPAPSTATPAPRTDPQP